MEEIDLHSNRLIACTQEVWVVERQTNRWTNTQRQIQKQTDSRIESYRKTRTNISEYSC